VNFFFLRARKRVRPTLA